MIWSVPRPVLLVVACVIVVAALWAFVMGVLGTARRGRLPGESAGDDGAAQIQAVEARPLAVETIEASLPPAEPTETESARVEAERRAQAATEAAASARAERDALTAAQTSPPPQATPPAPALPPPVAPPPVAPQPKARPREEPVF